MKVVVLVHVGETLQRLEYYIAYHLFGEKLAALSHQLIHVQIEVFEHKMQSVTLQANFVEAHNIWM